MKFCVGDIAVNTLHLGNEVLRIIESVSDIKWLDGEPPTDKALWEGDIIGLTRKEVGHCLEWSDRSHHFDFHLVPAAQFIAECARRRPKCGVLERDLIAMPMDVVNAVYDAYWDNIFEITDKICERNRCHERSLRECVQQIRDQFKLGGEA